MAAELDEDDEEPTTLFPSAEDPPPWIFLYLSLFFFLGVLPDIFCSNW
jgi:hypothetical protein